MFQRESMRALQLSPLEWKSCVRECGQKWKNMPLSEKEAYCALAAEQQGLREEAMLQPFKPADGPQPLGEASFDAAALVSRNGLVKLSAHRLLATYKAYKSSDGWGDFDAGLATSTGAMPLDAIDLENSPETISSTWSSFVRPVDRDEEYDEAARMHGCVHHTVCGQGHGLCQKLPYLTQASKFASSLHNFLKEGHWPAVASGLFLSMSFCVLSQES